MIQMINANGVGVSADVSAPHVNRITVHCSYPLLGLYDSMRRTNVTPPTNENTQAGMGYRD